MHVRYLKTINSYTEVPHVITEAQNIPSFDLSGTTRTKQDIIHHVFNLETVRASLAASKAKAPRWPNLIELKHDGD